MAVGAVATPTPAVSNSPNDVLKSPEARLKTRNRLDSADLRSSSTTLLPSHSSRDRTENKPSSPHSNCASSEEAKHTKPRDDSKSALKPNKPNKPAAESTVTNNPSKSQAQSPKSKKPAKPTASCVCEGCSEAHDGSYGSGRFCSVHCARRIAASRKWEKQRSERKHLAAVAAAAAAAAAVVGAPQLGPMEQSTSSLSSASSLDATMARPIPIPHGAAMKRRRVLMMPPSAPQHAHMHSLHPPSTPTPPPQSLHMASHLHHSSHPLQMPSSHPQVPVHHSVGPDIVHPQPQQYVRHNALPPPQSVVTQVGVGRPPLSATPSPGPYVDYTHMPVRAISPFHYAQPSTYFPYAPHPVAYPTPPPQAPSIHSQYPYYGKPSVPNPPPPPPPTPAPDSAHQVPQQPAPPATRGAKVNRPLTKGPTAKGQISSEKECKAVIEALLCLKKGNLSD